MSDQISAICERLNVSDMEAISKAKELQRMMTFKVPSNTLRKGEVCRPVIAIDLACQLLQVFVSKNALIQQAAVTAKIYNDSLITCKKFMEIVLPNNVTIENLCLKYGFNDMISAAHDLLKVLQASTNRPPIPGTTGYDSLCHGVSLYVAMKRKKVNMNRQKLIEDIGCNSQEFKNLLSTFETILANDLSSGIKERTQDMLASPSQSYGQEGGEQIGRESTVPDEGRKRNRGTIEDSSLSRLIRSDAPQIGALVADSTSIENLTESKKRRLIQMSSRGADMVSMDKLNSKEAEEQKKYHDTVYEVWKHKVLSCEKRRSDTYPSSLR